MNTFISPITVYLLIISFAASGQQKENSNIIMSDAAENYRFTWSGARNTVEVKEELAYKYTCRNYRESMLFYNFFDDQTTLDDAELAGNGKKVRIPKELKDYQMEDIFYSDARIYTLKLDFPQSGWENEIRLKKTIRDPRYFCTVYFSEPNAIGQKEVTLTIPRWMKADIKEFNFEGYNIEKSQTYSSREDADVIRYLVKDLPPRKEEEHLPGPSYYLPHLLILCRSAMVNGRQFTYFNTVQDQYNWYRSITASMQNDKTIIKAKAEEITAGIKDDMARVKAVLYWVQDNIRYIAFENGMAGYKPDEAQNVLHKKYGDCKGMANLTKELLTSLGFDARLTWIGTNNIAYDYSTPSLCVDNHMICCLFYNGKKYFLDGTETYLPLGSYAERIQGRQVLIENGDRYILERIPATGCDQNTCTFKENLKINNNNLSGSIEYLYNGESKEQLLSSIHNTKNENLQSSLEKYITNDNRNYVINQVKTAGIDQTDGHLSIKFNLNYSGAVSSFGNEIFVDPDYNKTFDQAYIDTAGRHYDYRFAYKYNYNSEVDLEVPAGYKVAALPSDFEYKHAGFYFSVTHKTEGNLIKYRKKLQILNTLLSKSDFGEWNKAITGLSEKYTDQITLIKNQ